MTLASRGGVNPYLVPIKFVKALMTPSLLFMGEEEIFLPEVVDVQGTASSLVIERLLMLTTVILSRCHGY